MTLAYSQPNQSEASFEPQARGYGEELEIIAASASLYPIKCVLDGCVTSASTGLTVATTLGVVWYDGAPIVVAADTATAATADGTHPRIDYVYYDVGLDNVVVASGTAASDPQPPDLDDDWIMLAELTIPASLTTITGSHIVDKRTLTGEPPHVGTWYVNPNGEDPGSSTWTGWGKRPEVAFTKVLDAVTAASSGDTIAMLGEETFGSASDLVSTSKTLKFVGITPGAGWRVNSFTNAAAWFTLTGDNCEFHDLTFTGAYTTFSYTGWCIDGQGASKGRIYNCDFNGYLSPTYPRLLGKPLTVGDGWKVRGNYFKGGGTVLELATGYAIVTQNTFDENCGTGIIYDANFQYNSKRAIISDNLFFNVGSRDIDVRYATVKDNYFVMDDPTAISSKYGAVRARSGSLVTGNNFYLALSSDTTSHAELVEVDDYSFVTGNRFEMNAWWDGFAIATYVGGDGGNYISNNHFVRSGGTSAVANYVFIQLRGPEDVAANNYFRLRPASLDSIVGIDCDSYRQHVHGNFFLDETDGAYSSLTFVSPHSSGTSMRDNWVSRPSVSAYQQQIPEETVQFVSAAYAVTSTDLASGLIQASGTGAITLPEATVAQYDYGLVGATLPFTIQRKDATNSTTINVEDAATDVIWKDGTNTYTSISLASNGAAVCLYWDDTDWMVLWDRGTVNYT